VKLELHPRSWQTLADRLFQAGAAHICGAACEVPSGTPHANMEAMARFARSRS
jgi:uroporphyrinogen-III decarboxylase